MFEQTFKFGTLSHEVKIDFEKLPQASRDFIIAYGLRQYLADGAAKGKEATDQEKLDGVTARVKKLEDGSVNTRVVGPRITDPEERAKHDIAKGYLRSAYKAAGKDMPKGDALAKAVDRFWASETNQAKLKTVLANKVREYKALADAQGVEVDLGEEPIVGEPAEA